VARGQRGFTLVEVVVSIAVLGMTSAALMSAMSTGFLGYRVVERDATAGRLAIDQMENTKAFSPYRVPVAQASCPTVPVSSYPAITPPSGYVVTVAASTAGRDLCTLEKITVTVTHIGRVIKTLEDYKGNR